MGGSTLTGGYGGYSVGLVLLNKTKIYINNGGSGKAATATGITYTGGYNGGGTAYYWQGNNTANGSGGGATHIALDSGLLKNLSSHRADGRILIVAGGGGGSALDTSGNGTGKGGNGGGIVGVDGIISSNKDGYYGLGGTQTTGGGYVLGDEDRRNTRTVPSSGTFGRGGDSAPLSNIDNVSGGGAGAGAGFFGGGGAGVWCGAGGGSGYIGSSNLISGGGITKHMTCYSCTTSSVAATRTYSNTNVSETATADYSKTGNGYARITYLGTSI